MKKVLLSMLLCILVSSLAKAQSALWARQRMSTIVLQDKDDPTFNELDAIAHKENSSSREASSKKTVVNLEHIEGMSNFNFDGATIVPKLKVMAGLTGTSKRFDSDDNAKKTWLRSYSTIALGGLQTSEDNSYFDQASSIFIPEKAFWYLDFQGGLLFGRKNFFLGTHFHFNYGNKKMKVIEDLADALPESINPGVVNLKTGLELVMFNRVSVYGNYGYTSILSDYSNAKSYLGLDYGEYWHFSGGIRAILNIRKEDAADDSKEKTDPVKLHVDLGGIILSKRMSDMIQTQDRIVPTIQLGATIPFLRHGED